MMALPASSKGRSHAPRAFTLIEMLISMALMIIMFTMYYGYGSRSHQRSMQKDCEGNLQKVYLSLQIFANDHGGKYPEAAGAQTAEEPLDELVPHYTVDTTIFICPGSKAKPLPAGESFLKHKISYAFYMGQNSTNTTDPLMSDAQANTASKTNGDTLFSIDGKVPGNNHYKYGGNVMFVDGHIEYSPSKAAFPLVMKPGIILLNPKP